MNSYLVPPVLLLRTRVQPNVLVVHRACLQPMRAVFNVNSVTNITLQINTVKLRVKVVSWVDKLKQDKEEQPCVNGVERVSMVCRAVRVGLECFAPVAIRTALSVKIAQQATTKIKNILQRVCVASQGNTSPPKDNHTAKIAHQISTHHSPTPPNASRVKWAKLPMANPVPPCVNRARLGVMVHLVFLATRACLEKVETAMVLPKNATLVPSVGIKTNEGVLLVWPVRLVCMELKTMPVHAATVPQVNFEV